MPTSTLVTGSIAFIGLAGLTLLSASVIHPAYAYAQSVTSPSDDANVGTPQGFHAGEPLFHRHWQLGAYAMGGWPPDFEIHSILHYQEEVIYSSASLEAGFMLTNTHGVGPFRGRAEAMLEVTPFWLAHEPKQED